MTLNINHPSSNQSVSTIALADTTINPQSHTTTSNTVTQSAQAYSLSTKTAQVKAPFNSEAAAAYGTFKQEIIKSRQSDSNSANASEEKTTGDTLSRQKRSDSTRSAYREGANEANDLFNTLFPSTQPHQKSEDPSGANDLFNVLNAEPEAEPEPTPAPAPPESGVDERMGADILHKDLNDYDKRISAQSNPIGDSQLATVVANTMLGLKDSDLATPSPMVDIPKESTYGKWLEASTKAFSNTGLASWANDNNIDRSSLSYDSANGVLHGKTWNDEEKSFTQEEFSQQFPKHQEAFKPLVDIAKIIYPSGQGVLHAEEPTDRASLDSVLSFYGLPINKDDISSTHQVAKDLADNNSFPESANSPDRTNDKLLQYQESVSTLNDKIQRLLDKEYEENSNKGNFMAIEVSASGGARMAV